MAAACRAWYSSRLALELCVIEQTSTASCSNCLLPSNQLLQLSSSFHPSCSQHLAFMVVSRVLAVLLCAPASAQFGNLEVKWQMDDSTGSKDATPSMGPPEPKAKLDGQTRATNLRGLSSEGLEGIVKSFGLSCDTCTNAGHWISRVRSGGANRLGLEWPCAFMRPMPSRAPSQCSRCSCASSSHTSKSADSSATNAYSASGMPCQKSAASFASRRLQCGREAFGVAPPRAPIAAQRILAALPSRRLSASCLVAGTHTYLCTLDS